MLGHAVVNGDICYMCDECCRNYEIKLREQEEEKVRKVNEALRDMRTQPQQF